MSKNLHVNKAGLSAYTQDEIVEIHAVLDGLFQSKIPAFKDTCAEFVSIIGYPGAGKSRVGYRMEQSVHGDRSGHVLIDVNDNCLCALPGYIRDVKENGYEPAYEKWRDASNWIVEQALDRAIAGHYDIIHTGTGTSPYIGELYTRVSKNNYNLKVYGYAAPLDLSMARCQPDQRFRHCAEEQKTSFRLPENHITDKRGLYVSAISRLGAHGLVQHWNTKDNQEPEIAFSIQDGSLIIHSISRVHEFLMDAGVCGLEDDPEAAMRGIVFGPASIAPDRNLPAPRP